MENLKGMQQGLESVSMSLKIGSNAMELVFKEIQEYVKASQELITAKDKEIKVFEQASKLKDEEIVQLKDALRETASEYNKLQGNQTEVSENGQARA